MAVRPVDLQLAEQLDLTLQPYTSDATLMHVVLDALIRRGWEPKMHYDPDHRSWHCMLVGPGFHRAEHADLAKAVVFAAVRALDGR